MFGHYRQRLRTTLGSSAAPYGYTLATWTSGAVLIHDRGFPNALAALSFMLEAVLGFAAVGVLAFGGLTRHFDSDYGEAPLVGKFSFLVGSVGDWNSGARDLPGRESCFCLAFRRVLVHIRLPAYGRSGGNDCLQMGP
jgi:hypothetical protein